MTKRRRPLTAEQLLTDLHQNPTWQREQERRDGQLIARQVESVAEQKDLLKDLASVGCRVDTVWDLVNSTGSYAAAIPVLLAHAVRPYSTGVREGIIRALTTDSAAGTVSCEILINEYKKLNDSSPNSLKWVLGNAISIVAVRECATEIVKLIRDKANGRARDMMTLRLTRICPRNLARQILKELLDDPEIGTFADRALATVERGVPR